MTTARRGAARREPRRGARAQPPRRACPGRREPASCSRAASASVSRDRRGALLAAPLILLLDESTSSLDGLNGSAMRDAIDAVATDRTLIVIAHRLSTVVDSDHIVVMDHGQVVGQGTHSDLVDSTPLYRDLAGISSWSDPAPRAPTPSVQAATESVGASPAKRMPFTRGRLRPP